MLQFLKKISQSISKKGYASESSFIPAALLISLGHLGLFVFWSEIAAQPYVNIKLRIVCAILGLPLIFKNYWPRQIRPLLPFYWYAYLIFSLSFFYTYMLMRNDFAVAWQINTVTALIFVILVTDWLSVIAINLIGITIGIAAYFLVMHDLYISSDIVPLVINYVVIIVLCGLFMYRKSKVEAEKIKSMHTIASSIAHELRTPLRAIDSGVSGIKKYLPNLVEGYQIAQQAELQVPYIAPQHFKSLGIVAESLLRETSAAFNVIDMLLIKMNLSHEENIILRKCSIKEYVKDVIERYPFEPNERELVKVHELDDFEFLGDPTFFAHILFNLIKNALYFIHASRKGHIEIWTRCSARKNYLHFRDTGAGIPPKVLPHIFDQFFTTTAHGTGVGLAFSKLVMQSFGGEITCRSVEGEFTEFLLEFPPFIDEV